MVSKGVYFFVAAVLAVMKAGAFEIKPIAYVDSEIESAHVSIGRLKVAYPGGSGGTVGIILRVPPKGNSTRG